MPRSGNGIHGDVHEAVEMSARIEVRVLVPTRRKTMQFTLNENESFTLLLKEAAKLTGYTTKPRAWMTNLTGEALGMAALAAVLRRQAEPAPRTQVERAVAMVLLPRLLQSQLDATTQRKWKSVIGSNDIAIESVTDLNVPWNAVVRAALQQHVLVADSAGRWSAGPDIDDVSVSALDARAVVVLSWIVSGAAEEALQQDEITRRDVHRVARRAQRAEKALKKAAKVMP